MEELLIYKNRPKNATDMECKLQPMPEEVVQRGGDILRGFLRRMRSLPSLSDGMVWELLRVSPTRHVTI